MRLPRSVAIAVTGVFHKMWHGHNREYILDENTEKSFYLRALTDTFTDELKQQLQFHSFCLMGSHAHEVGRALPTANGNLRPAVEALGNWMRNAHSRFGAGYNRRHDRRGKVAYDRPRTLEIKNEWEVLRTMFYGDANPVRARMVSHPSCYPHSSYHFYAKGKKSRITEHLTPPAGYLALGKTADERRRRYRELVDLYLRQEGLLRDCPEEEVEESTSKNAFDDVLYSIRIRGAP